MTSIPQRELRNDVSRILARAAKGERFVVTVNGRDVAELGPVRPATRHAWQPMAVAERIRRAAPLDPGFADDVRDYAGDTIDEL